MKAGEDCEAVFLVRNLTDQPVRILGVTTSCACVSTAKLPVVVPPRETRPMPVALHLEGAQPGFIVQTATYHTDHPAAPSLRATVKARVAAP